MPWFEDFNVGYLVDLGTHHFVQEEMVAFARKFEPRDFYLDTEAAKSGPFGELIACRMYITATWMKMLTRKRFEIPPHPDALGRMPQQPISPGFLEMKFPQPIRPGEVISLSTRPIEKADLKSRPDWGMVRSHNEATNARGELVLSFIGQELVQRMTPIRGERKS
jgi:acyl dehydratase